MASPHQTSETVRWWGISHRAALGLILAMVSAMRVSAIEEKRFENNWRAIPKDLKTAKKVTGDELKLNKAQKEAINQRYIHDPDFNVDKHILTVDELKTLSMTSWQLDQIGLVSDEDREKAGIDKKSRNALRIEAAGLDEAIVTGLEMILYHRESPVHYAILLTTDRLPVIKTDFGYEDNNMYKFLTLGSKPRVTIATVPKILAPKKTIKDFDKHVRMDLRMMVGVDVQTCIAYAGKMLIYAIGQCGVEGITDKKDNRGRACAPFNRDTVVQFMREIENKGWFQKGDGWTSMDFRERQPGRGDAAGYDDVTPIDESAWAAAKSKKN